MRIGLAVRNFAKIEEAKVCINKYTVFVGPNNCGKTFLMQLIEGLNGYWDKLIDDSAMNALIYEESEHSRIFKINSASIKEFVKVINLNIKSEWENIVVGIFEKKISIGEIELEVLLNPGEEFIILNGKDEEAFNQLSKQMPEMFDEDTLDSLNKIHIRSDNPFCLVKRKKSQNDSYDLWGASVGGDNIGLGAVKRWIKKLFETNSLFMPASRNGLMLLYREFFAHKTDSLLSFQMNDGTIHERGDGLLNLTRPMYDFLRFLQTYSFDETGAKVYQNLIQFYNDKIIEGKISTEAQSGFQYTNQFDMENVPMHLTSSMVNEVAPLFLALTSKKGYERFIIDEVEASLHPEKQRELVRFLNRLYNGGHQFIISTHSDTFVNKLNNLAILSNYVHNHHGEKVLEQFDVEMSDLVEVEELCIYEFVQNSNGQCVVNEKMFNTKCGYQFDLFTQTAMDIYNEAIKLEELTKDV